MNFSSMSSEAPRVNVYPLKQVDDELVGAHHDGRIGDLSDQMCGESSVKSSIAFLSKHQAETLEERAVLGTFFP